MANFAAISISRTTPLRPEPNLVTILTPAPIRKSGRRQIVAVITRTVSTHAVFLHRYLRSRSILQIRQNARSVWSHGNRVLEVSRDSAILGLDRPTVG
jgi:hypothetical protein